MKKLGLICLVLCVALASLGIAYAKWSQNLTVHGKVSTGTFDVVFDSFTAPSGSNGATFSATRTDSHNYTITCNNLYPGLDGIFTFVLRNTGTIPAKIADIKIDGASVLSKNKDLGSPGDGKTDITITVQDISTSTTIGVGSTVTGHLKVHTWKLSPDGNDATQLASGSFTLEINTEQQ
jgi:hypothetical protein